MQSGLIGHVSQWTAAGLVLGLFVGIYMYQLVAITLVFHVTIVNLLEGIRPELTILSELGWVDNIFASIFPASQILFLGFIIFSMSMLGISSLPDSEMMLKELIEPPNKPDRKVQTKNTLIRNLLERLTYRQRFGIAFFAFALGAAFLNGNIVK